MNFWDFHSLRSLKCQFLWWLCLLCRVTMIGNNLTLDISPATFYCNSFFFSKVVMLPLFNANVHHWKSLCVFRLKKMEEKLRTSASSFLCNDLPYVKRSRQGRLIYSVSSSLMSWVVSVILSWKWSKDGFVIDFVTFKEKQNWKFFADLRLRFKM